VLGVVEQVGLVLVMTEVGGVEGTAGVVGVFDLWKIEAVFLGGCCGICITGTGKSLGDKSGL
jgi:hypothetical protein